MLSSRAARKARHKKSRRLSRALKATEAIQGKSLAQQEALQRQATQQQLGGFDVAKREASRLGRASKQSVLDREQQAGASLSQGLANRGLGSTTVGANLQRGLASDTNRQLQGVNEGLAGMFGDLSLGRAGAEAQGTMNLAGLAGQRGDLQSGLSQMGLLGGQQLGQFDIGAWDQPNAMQNLLHGISTGAGAFMGGQGGGGGGQNDELMKMMQKLFQGQGGGGGGGDGIGSWGG